MQFQNNNIKLLEVIESSKFSLEILSLLNSHQKSIRIKSLTGSLPALLIASLFGKSQRNFFILTKSNQEAEDWLHNLKLLLPNEKLSILIEPKRNIKFEAGDLDEHLLWIMDGLSNMQKSDYSITIATPEIFNILLPQSNQIEKDRKTISRGDTVNYEEFIRDLALNGFDKKDFVSMQGDLAVRGGIVDFFPIGWDRPIRIEFWGDIIESIREFDSLSQRSIGTHEKIEFIANIFHQSRTPIESTIFDYIKPDSVFVLDSPEFLTAEYDEFEIPAQYTRIEINCLGDADIEIRTTEQPRFHGSVRKLAVELRSLSAMNYKIFLCADGKIHLERLKDLVENSIHDDIDLIDEEAPLLAEPEAALNSIIWIDHAVSGGFIYPEERLAVFTEHEIFDRLRIQEDRKAKKYAGGISLRELKQLNIGDYIVHVDKGVGRFDGFEKITLGGSLQDCVRLLYADNDILYVHLNYIQKIQKYTAQEGVEPKLSKLGSSEWLRKKARAKKRLKDIARDLIKLYAQRKMQFGHEFPTDNIWQKEFEASFIYEDTADQARTTDEVKKDMENTYPMDRLVCGDVGFGKTEIAIRAAFKAILAGKQCALLVPTTILAQQHYMTFRDRLSRYPVRVEALSRFRSQKEQTRILKDLKSGAVDILIGTHRILSKDIEFKDLGLLIIDEEHRFGVGAKEKLRQIRVNVDTLTLTATPIPRTLNFSLMGARDLSIIETPPRNRLPIMTEILEWRDSVIQKSINQEIERGGQVFFVTDKVDGMDRLAMKLKMLMPTIRFGIAHGQMKSSELERNMEKFIEGKFDVLLATKIVESGLDIPNANTMLINNANNFGLAELYQLRGRVGRSNQQAFCYMLIPPVKILTTKALRRLQAIEEFTLLGSGFQLAMRDLEIRGAGNLLGPEQSGYINEIGFELYHKILDEAVQELRLEELGEAFDDKLKSIPIDDSELAIEIDSEALLPAEYIRSDTERFYFYKKLYDVRNNEDLQSIVEELEDRFGRLTKQASELIFAVKVRIAALSTGFTKVSLKQNRLIAEFPSETKSQYYELIFPFIAEFIMTLSNVRLNQDKKGLSLEAKIENRDEALEILWRIKKTIKAINS